MSLHLTYFQTFQWLDSACSDWRLSCAMSHVNSLTDMYISKHINSPPPWEWLRTQGHMWEPSQLDIFRWGAAKSWRLMHIFYSDACMCTICYEWWRQFDDGQKMCTLWHHSHTQIIYAQINAWGDLEPKGCERLSGKNWKKPHSQPSVWHKEAQCCSEALSVLHAGGRLRFRAFIARIKFSCSQYSCQPACFLVVS